MLASNGQFVLTGELRDLARALDFAAEVTDWKGPFTRQESPCIAGFQVGEKAYYIGWGVEGQEGWTVYPFTWDPEIVARVAAQYLEAFPIEGMQYGDGTWRQGFKMTAGDSLTSEDHEKVKGSFHIMCKLEPYGNYYAK